MRSLPFFRFCTRPLADLLIIMEDDAPEGEGHAHFTLLTNQRQQRLSLLEWLEEKVSYLFFCEGK